MEYTKTNQVNKLGEVIDEIVTITEYTPKVTVKSKTELLKEKEELLLKIQLMNDRIKFIEEVTK